MTPAQCEQGGGHVEQHAWANCVGGRFDGHVADPGRPSVIPLPGSLGGGITPAGR
ncbi:hypothetical protein ACH474_22260 [Nocardia rhamnosiphila]|uniref:Uncharacterized protein n=1 Tax=Nocardia rhamnosiphila TaxID=426716 RepID=A0ABV2WN03_9NOCA